LDGWPIICTRRRFECSSLGEQIDIESVSPDCHEAALAIESGMPAPAAAAAAAAAAATAPTPNGLRGPIVWHQCRPVCASSWSFAVARSASSARANKCAMSGSMRWYQSSASSRSAMSWLADEATTLPAPV